MVLEFHVLDSVPQQEYTPLLSNQQSLSSSLTLAWIQHRWVNSMENLMKTELLEA